MRDCTRVITDGASGHESASCRILAHMVSADFTGRSNYHLRLAAAECNPSFLIRPAVSCRSPERIVLRCKTPLAVHRGATSPPNIRIPQHKKEPSEDGSSAIVTTLRPVRTGEVGDRLTTDRSDPIREARSRSVRERQASRLE